MALPTTMYTWGKQPHFDRSLEILKKYPEIHRLFGYDWRSKYFALITLCLQILITIYSDFFFKSWWQLLSCAFVIGGTCSHSLTLAIHEMSHGLFFKKRQHNEIFSLVCNWPLLFPYAASFTEYHLEHHHKLGTEGIDTDLPTEWECLTFNTSFMKFIWVLFQPLFYAARPVIINPKPLKFTNLINILSQSIF